MHIPPDKLPDPWLFDSEKLLRELARLREMILLIPVNGDPHAAHFAINNAISANWNLEVQLRFLLSLHKDGQRAFANRHQENKDERQKSSGPALHTPAPRRLLARSSQTNRK
jgi:hypothetical protein